MNRVKKINPNNFRKYGKLIGYGARAKKKDVRNLWRIVHESINKTGWRIAYLVLRERTVSRMERHPKSDETFEPIKGKALLFVARKKSLSQIECFSLDKPIVLYKGTWHAILKADKECELKITENVKVNCEYWDFGFRVKTLKQIQDRAVAGQKVFRFWKQV